MRGVGQPLLARLQADYRANSASLVAGATGGVFQDRSDRSRSPHVGNRPSSRVLRSQPFFPRVLQPHRSNTGGVEAQSQQSVILRGTAALSGLAKRPFGDSRRVTSRRSSSSPRL